MSWHLRLAVCSFIAAFAIAATLEAQTNVPQAAPAAAGKQATPDVAIPPVPVHDPAVESIMESNPQTPRQMLRAAGTLADLGRPDLAKQFLSKLAGAKLDENALADLAAQSDPDALLRMATNKALVPEGQQVADAVLTAGAKRARDPQRLHDAIDRLNDPSRGVKQDAVAAILAAHEDAVPALLLALADEKNSAVRPLLLDTLAHLGPAAVSPLTAALQSDNTALKTQIIDVLSQIGSRDAVPYLAAPATAESSLPEVREAAQAALLEIQNVTRPTAESAAKLLAAEIELHLKHEKLLKPDAEGNVDVWHWDAAARVPVREKLPGAMADAVMAARLADDLILLEPNDARVKRFFLVSTLEAAADRAGLDKPLPQGAGTDFERAAKFGAPAVEDALAFAMATGHTPAAIAAAQVLGASGDRSLLDARGGQPRALVQMLSQRDRRLRFAAAEAIMNLDPKSGFAGSSDLMSTLAFIAGSSGTRRALVVFPNEAVAAQLSAMLATMGYDADTAVLGRQGFIRALGSSDYELVVLSSHIDRPPVWVVLQELRHDPRTARLPVILLAEDPHDDLDRMQSLAAGDLLATAFERPVTPDGMKFFVDRMTQQTNGMLVPMNLREQQAATALAWLKKLYLTSAREFDLQPYEAGITRAFHTPKLSAAAAELLGLIGTHTAQRSLVDMANRTIDSMPMRQAAAAAFSESVRKHGIQLTTVEMRHQYDRYNQSALEDAATQQLLGLILDAIELPTSVSKVVPRPPAPQQ